MRCSKFQSIVVDVVKIFQFRSCHCCCCCCCCRLASTRHLLCLVIPTQCVVCDVDVNDDDIGIWNVVSPQHLPTTLTHAHGLPPSMRIRVSMQVSRFHTPDTHKTSAASIVSFMLPEIITHDIFNMINITKPQIYSQP